MLCKLIKRLFNSLKKILWKVILLYIYPVVDTKKPKHYKLHTDIDHTDQSKYTQKHSPAPLGVCNFISLHYIRVYD